MSADPTSKRKVTVKIIEIEDVPPEKRNSDLSTALFNISRTHPMLGGILQCMDIVYAHFLPTAGVGFDSDGKKWMMYINPHFFCKRLSPKGRIAVLLHEIYHIVHKHPMRVPFLRLDDRRRRVMNVAMDMAINQYIEDMPYGCPECRSIPLEQPCPSMKRMEETGKESICPGRMIRLQDYFDEDKKGNKTPWPPNKPAEFYYNKLLQQMKENEDAKKQDPNGESKTGEASGDGIPAEWDQHAWDATGEEAEMLDATEELVKRAMQKTNTTYSKLPGAVRELLEEIEARRTELDYRGIILGAIKRSASGQDRKHTWTRKSKRYGNLAPGTKLGDLPKLHCIIDTSGSISIEEANEFLGIVDEFLRVGDRKCKVSLFHTKLYLTRPYRLGEHFARKDFESGGTCLNEAMQMVADTRPDLTLILTDGYFSDVNIESMLPSNIPFPQTLFIISRHGTIEHPLTRVGESIKIPETAHITKDQKL